MSTEKPHLKLVFFVTLLLNLSVVVCNQLTVSITGTGPSQIDLNDTVTEALASCQARDFLNGTSHRVLTSEFQSQSSESKASTDLYQATVYDYSHGRSILISGSPFDTTALTFTETNVQPPSNSDELADAASIAGARPGDIVQTSMPPVLTTEFDDGTSQRILNLDITSGNSSRIVHVNMNTRTVVTPKNTRASEKRGTCAATVSSNDIGSARGIPGEGNFIISLGTKQLWTFRAIRPSASSGLRGSGIELRDVKYKGKTVLYRAHVPILNVEYEKRVPGCGPHYRDWQWEEYPLRCNGGTGFPPGFRLCNSPAKTILDPPSIDGGNFRGVAVYVDGQEVVLKAQLQAAWYRYISEWRFHVNGELRPRWGFGGVLNTPGCVCVIHRHHVYWRFDFDIESPWSNLVKEFNDPPINGNSKYHEKVYEIRRPKHAKRHWEISNTRSGNAYSLTPGRNDGTSTAFGVGDVWVLRYHSDLSGDLELDDGVNSVGGSSGVLMEHIDNFVNGERVKNKDVVVWYAAHFKHDQSRPGSHIVGPTLRPVKW